MSVMAPRSMGAVKAGLEKCPSNHQGNDVTGHAFPADTRNSFVSSDLGPEVLSAPVDASSSIPQTIALELSTVKTNDAAPLAFSTSTSSPQRGQRARGGSNLTQEERRRRRLMQIVHELHEWVRKGSPDSRTTYLQKVNKAKVSSTNISCTPP
jgi:hypothetical protein